METVFFMGAIREPQFPDWETSADNYENIQQAVDACALAGGGTVIVGEGQWETGPIRMYSNISFTNVKGSGAKAGLMPKGLAEQKLEDIMLQDVELTAQEAMTCSGVSRLVMERVVLKDK